MCPDNKLTQSKGLMKRIINAVREWFTAMGMVFRNEWHLIFGDIGVVLFFVALPLAYPVVYTLIYNPEVVTDMPIAVVDHSRTARSRELVRDVSAAPAFDIYCYADNLDQARDLMFDNKVVAIMEIPADYGKKIGRGEQATVPFYSNMGLLLRYRTSLAACTDIQMMEASKILGERTSAAGLTSVGGGLPVRSESNFMGDTEQGFASFVIPGIVILILQQSLVLGVVFIIGTSRERRRRNGGTDPLSVEGVPASAVAIGKSLCYFLLYVPSAIYVMHFIPEMFNLPHFGSPVDYLLFIVPMLMASSLLGITMAYFAKERESAFVLVVFTSVLFLFLSGLTWPRYAMSTLWTAVGDLVPATWGVEGFIRINSNSASLGENSTPYLAMWLLTVLYFVTACLSLKLIERSDRRKAMGSAQTDSDSETAQG